MEFFCEEENGGMDEFDEPHAPNPVCVQLSLDEYDCQRLQETEKALRGLEKTIRRKPALLLETRRKRRQEERELAEFNQGVVDGYISRIYSWLLGLKVTLERMLY
jgi:hypothetical protein